LGIGAWARVAPVWPLSDVDIAGGDETTSGFLSPLKSATPQKPSLTVAAVQSTLPRSCSWRPPVNVL
jgi:hypothetical protein